MFIRNHDGKFIEIKSDRQGRVLHGFASGDAVIIGDEDGKVYYLSSAVLLATAPGSYPLAVGTGVTFQSDGVDVVTSVVALKRRQIGTL
jgi:hypothetical protein